MARPQLKVVVIGSAFVVLALVVTVWLLRDHSRGGGKRYASAEEAVTVTCHAAHIVWQQPAGTSGLRIGWQEAGQPNGVGWVALVTKRDSRYLVSSCKQAGFSHG
jgi:hypothetical protein